VQKRDEEFCLPDVRHCSDSGSGTNLQDYYVHRAKIRWTAPAFASLCRPSEKSALDLFALFGFVPGIVYMLEEPGPVAWSIYSDEH
jgi:hypothetical protein